MPAEALRAGAALPAYSGVYVFGDSLVDPGNDLRAAEALGALPFVSVPSGAPTADKGYFEGRFTDGYTFADLISNKLLHAPTAATFPYGFRDPVLNLSIPFVNRPEGHSLNFAYGGARVVQGLNPAPGIDAQTDIYGRFTPDPNALYVIAIGANDVLAMVPKNGDPVVGAAAEARLSTIASELTQEVAELYARGARHIVVAEVPGAGLIPYYSGSANEAAHRSLLSEYTARVDVLLKGDLGRLALPAGATLLDYDFLGYTDAATADPAAYGFTNVTESRRTVQADGLDPAGGGFLFFDNFHPSAQAHAQIAAELLDALRGRPPVGSLAPSMGPQVAGAIPVGGVDTFHVSLAAGATYVIDLMGVSSGAGSLADPRLRVLDASGAVVGRNDDGGLGLDAHLRFTAPATGVYAIQVRGVGVSAGDYRLQAGEVGGPNLLPPGGRQGSDVAALDGSGLDNIDGNMGAGDEMILDDVTLASLPAGWIFAA